MVIYKEYVLYILINVFCILILNMKFIVFYNFDLLKFLCSFLIDDKKYIFFI